MSVDDRRALCASVVRRAGAPALAECLLLARLAVAGIAPQRAAALLEAAAGRAMRPWPSRGSGTLP